MGINNSQTTAPTNNTVGNAQKTALHVMFRNAQLHYAILDSSIKTDIAEQHASQDSKKTKQIQQLFSLKTIS